jgi:hypothetical protein
MSSEAMRRHARAENFEIVLVGEVAPALLKSLDGFVIVLVGEVAPALLKSLDGFVITRVDDGRTHVVGRVNDQTHIYDVLAVIGDDAGVDLVSFNPEPG